MSRDDLSDNLEAVVLNQQELRFKAEPDTVWSNLIVGGFWLDRLDMAHRGGY